MGWRDYLNSGEDSTTTAVPDKEEVVKSPVTTVDWDKISLKRKETIPNLAKKVIRAKDEASLIEYVSLFKLSMYKRSLIRIAKLTEMQDVLDNKLFDKVNNDYLKTETLLLLNKQVSEEIDKSNNIIKELTDTSEKVNQIVNVNVIQNNYNDFSSESREKIKLAVLATLEKLKSVPVDDAVDVTDTEPIVHTIDTAQTEDIDDLYKPIDID